MQDNNFITIPLAELDHVSGGGSAWDSYVKSQRTKVAPSYKNVVCTTAGIKGGPQLATGVYGKDRTTNADMIRGAQTLQSICLGGSHLPEQAPQSPF